MTRGKKFFTPEQKAERDAINLPFFKKLSESILKHTGEDVYVRVKGKRHLYCVKLFCYIATEEGKKVQDTGRHISIHHANVLHHNKTAIVGKMKEYYDLVREDLKEVEKYYPFIECRYCDVNYDVIDCKKCYERINER